MNAPTPNARLIAVARGDETPDLLLTNARVVNVFTRQVERASIAIAEGRVACLANDIKKGHETVDLGGKYVTPGFLDAHMHVESTMLVPSEFARLAVPHGTTGVVLDPHEIANVQGLEGIRFLMTNARGLPLRCFFGASSCVPSSPLEHAGAELSARDLAPLFDEPEVVALAEMMNYPGVIHADQGVLEKIALGLNRAIVDGHCPGLRGRPLQAYIASGISSDHESFTLDEAREKLARGMHVHIREGSAARNLKALAPLITPETADKISFCTDDRHPHDLMEDGHIDNILRRAVARGVDPVTAVVCATLSTSRHYRLDGLGAVAPGYHADLVVMEDLESFEPTHVVCAGELVAKEGTYLGTSKFIAGYPASPVTLPSDLSEESLRVPAPKGGKKIRVIGVDPHQLITENLTLDPTIENGTVVSDVERDVLKIAVIERHRGTGNIGLGFAQGFGLQSGAIASTVGHDAHNLAILGTNDADMALAARAVAEAGGGQCVVRDGEVLALLPLPIAGLMSDQDAETVIERQSILLEAARELGCPHEDPFMPLSFTPLPVIPHLKITDMGLVDVDAFEVVPIEA